MASERVTIYEDNAGGLWLHADDGEAVYHTTGERGAALEEARYVLENPDGDEGASWDLDLQGRWKHDFDPDSGEVEIIALYRRNAPELEIVNYIDAPRAGVAGHKYLGIAHPGWGGKRDGAGRPEHEEPLIRKTVTLTEKQIAYLEEIGHGNLSAGIRLLVEERKEV